MKTTVTFILLIWCSLALAAGEPPVVHSRIGTRVTAAGGALTLECVGKKQNFDWRDTLTRDPDVASPKSVAFHPDGTRFYVNSLEGCATVVYDARTLKKRTVIHHKFASGQGPLWAPRPDFHAFAHYPDGERRAFSGKPVESTFTHGGRYFWVPYYRRTFDRNAQDPSAIAIIDTDADSIVRMLTCGPLPKMIATSHNGNLVAVTHWGDNTVALIDISSPDPRKWRQLPPVAVEKQLQLNFPLDRNVDRDRNSGLLLRGTVFMPDDRYLLVSCMGGGGIAVIDVAKRRYLGKINGISNARHLITVGPYLYASLNVAGQVWRVPLDTIRQAIARLEQSSSALVTDWKMCRVGRGARTIEASPSGRFVFAACNSSSALHVVDTRTMTDIASISIDSYPVGLDISDDGTLLVVTSQARSGLGGNAVNLVRVTYADSLAEREAAERSARLARESAPVDSLSLPDDATAGGEGIGTALPDLLRRYAWAIVGAVLLVLGLLLARTRRK